MICPTCLEEDERIENDGDDCPECKDFFLEKEQLDNYYKNMAYEDNDFDISSQTYPNIGDL